MKTKEELVSMIDAIVNRDVISNHVDWYEIDKRMFIKKYETNNIFVLSTRKTGCDLFIFEEHCFNLNMINRLLGFYGISKFYLFYPSIDKEPEVSTAMELYHNLSLLYEEKGKGLIYTTKGWQLVDTK